MDTTDESPRKALGLLPTFTPPPPQPPAPSPTADPETARMYIPDLNQPSPSARNGRGTPKLGPGDILTETSSDGDVHKPTSAEAAALVAGLLGLVVAGAAWVVGRRLSRKLRKPTEVQTNDVAAPLGRILMRHADLSWLGPDIADTIKAASATGAYINDGPLILSTTPDAGVPTNLQEEL